MSSAHIHTSICPMYFSLLGAFGTLLLSSHIATLPRVVLDARVQSVSEAWPTHAVKRITSQGFSSSLQMALGALPLQNPPRILNGHARRVEM